MKKKNSSWEQLLNQLSTKEKFDKFVNSTFYESEDFPIFKKHMEILAKK